MQTETRRPDLHLGARNTRRSLPAVLLRLEGLAALGLSVLLYAREDASWWLFALLFLAPDVAALAYLAGPRAGSVAYNAVHTYVAPVVLGGAGLLADAGPAVALALIWAAHIGMDRALGYGLKYSSAFKDTHLQRV
jgi:hypothetical protein